MPNGVLLPDGPVLSGSMTGGVSYHTMQPEAGPSSQPKVLVPSKPRVVLMTHSWAGIRRALPLGSPTP